MKMFTFPSTAALVLAAGLLAAATQAQAHARLVSATPSANAAVAAPKTIAMTFSEKLEPKFSGAEVMKADGAKVAAASSVDRKSKKSITLAVKDPMAPGAYMVMWHVVSADGHRMKGDYNFTVH